MWPRCDFCVVSTTLRPRSARAAVGTSILWLVMVFYSMAPVTSYGSEQHQDCSDVSQFFHWAMDGWGKTFWISTIIHLHLHLYRESGVIDVNCAVHQLSLSWVDRLQDGWQKKEYQTSRRLVNKSGLVSKAARLPWLAATWQNNTDSHRQAGVGGDGDGGFKSETEMRMKIQDGSLHDKTFAYCGRFIAVLVLNL